MLFHLRMTPVMLFLASLTGFWNPAIGEID